MLFFVYTAFVWGDIIPTTYHQNWNNPLTRLGIWWFQTLVYFLPKNYGAKTWTLADFLLPAGLFGPGDVCKNLGPGISVFFC